MSDSQKRSPSKKTVWGTVWSILTVIIIVVGGIALYMGTKGRLQPSSTRPSSTAPNATKPTSTTTGQTSTVAPMTAEETKLANSLGIDPLPPGRTAPNFTLTNEDGKTVSLASLRGKVIVLQFMDPKCTDICPIVSQELVLADQELGVKASQVAFVGVNVNQYQEKPSELLAFSNQHGLGKLPNWYFLTGSTAALQQVWKNYGILVQPNPTGDVVHSSYYYFIDKNGMEQYLAPATNDKSTITEWAKGIAVFSQKLM